MIQWILLQQEIAELRSFKLIFVVCFFSFEEEELVQD